jgi:hypothetical protein
MGTPKARPIVVETIDNDGERKPLLRRINPANWEFVRLMRISEWSKFKAQPDFALTTQLALLGACLHIQGLEDQFPPKGQLVPVELMKGRTLLRSGRSMMAHMRTIDDGKVELRAKAKKFDEIKKTVQ